MNTREKTKEEVHSRKAVRLLQRARKHLAGFSEVAVHPMPRARVIQLLCDHADDGICDGGLRPER